MKYGLRISFSFSEFATAALLITAATCVVNYIYLKHQTQATEHATTCTTEPVIINHYITVPAPRVHIRIAVPPTLEPTPKPTPEVVPESQQQVPKVWDNDNISASVKAPKEKL